MKDIHAIGNSYVQGSFQLLGNASDRAQAALFFAELCSTNAKVGRAKHAEWCARASLSEFKSIFDVLGADMRKMRVGKIWDRSKYKGFLNQDPLIKILNKARDLSIHSVKLPGTHKAIQVNFVEGSGDTTQEISCLFFNKIERTMFNESAKYITDKELVWFNRQASVWPIDLLVREAVYRSSQPLAGFLSANHQYIRA